MRQIRAAKAFLCCTVASIAMFPAVGSAQDDGFADEILVTATRRAESIQTVGLSITALSGADLQARGAVELIDYARSIPNFAFGSTGDGILANNSVSIRGVEGANTTGFYLDDVPLSETIDPLVLDVERVEVLRGPQGT
ncbi:MAG: Plug domain-containing protein, partial [Pseudomonadota bacterium]